MLALFFPDFDESLTLFDCHEKSIERPAIRQERIVAICFLENSIASEDVITLQLSFPKFLEIFGVKDDKIAEVYIVASSVDPVLAVNPCHVTFLFNILMLLVKPTCDRAAQPGANFVHACTLTVRNVEVEVLAICSD